MATKDIHGNTYIYHDRKQFSKSETEESLIEYFFEDANIYRFIRKGSERKIHLSINPRLSIEELKKLLLKNDLDEDVEKIIKNMICKGTVKSGVFEVKGRS